MQSLSVPAHLNAVHAWAFVPAPLGTPQELLHSVEHRIFLDSSIASLENAVVRHNGMTYWSGIRLEFTVSPSRYGELIATLERLFSGKLPKMSFFERERFARELEEGGGHILDRALDRFRSGFFEANDLSVEARDEEDVWSKLDFAHARIFAVGEVAAESDPWPIRADRSNAEPFRFPVYKEELAEAAPELPFDPDEPYDGFDTPEGPIEYAVLFPSMARTPEEYAFHAVYFCFLWLRADEEFRDAGRTYDPIREHYQENGFAISALHLITSDRDRKWPSAPKKPDRRTFESVRDAFSFQMRIDHDRLYYGEFPVLGLAPSDALRAVESLDYDEFVRGFGEATERVSFFWGRRY